MQLLTQSFTQEIIRYASPQDAHTKDIAANYRLTWVSAAVQVADETPTRTFSLSLCCFKSVSKSAAELLFYLGRQLTLRVFIFHLKNGQCPSQKWNSNNSMALQYQNFLFKPTLVLHINVINICLPPRNVLKKKTQITYNLIHWWYRINILKVLLLLGFFLHLLICFTYTHTSITPLLKYCYFWNFA